jgi:hypothetical protein
MNAINCDQPLFGYIVIVGQRKPKMESALIQNLVFDSPMVKGEEGGTLATSLPSAQLAVENRLSLMVSKHLPSLCVCLIHTYIHT